MAGSSEIKEEYTSSLADLTFNSKPLISVLTMLAEEYIAQAKDIVEAIEAHLSRVRTEVKLPVLYLIDSIIKNLGGPYTSLFCQNIVSTFCNVFKEIGKLKVAGGRKVDERTRAEMFRLRQTWNDVIPAKKLYALDIQIKQLDPAWPVTAPPPNVIHFNPKFFKPTTTTALGNITTTTTTSSVPKVTAPLLPSANADLDEKTISMQQKLINKQRELLELQQRKLELELLQTQVKLQEQLKNKLPCAITTANVTTGTTSSLPLSTSAQTLLLKPEVAKQLSITSATSKTTNSTTNSKSRTGTHSVSSVLNAKLQQNTSSSATPRITPVQSNLANARPIRDPRLLRHQQQQQQQQQQQFQQAQQNSKTNNANVHLENKSKSLVNNKGNIESHGKSKTLPHSSPLKHTQKIGSSPRKTGKFSRESKSTLAASSSDSAASIVANLKSTSSSSLSSSSKSNSKSDTPTKNRLPKIKKKSSSARSDAVNRTEIDASSADKDGALLRFDKGTSSGASVRSDKDNSALMRIDKKSDNKHSNNKISKSDNKDKLRISKSEIMTTSFKELKGSTKNRNYMRRNRNASVSPEPNNLDVDLRLGAPPEKQPRLQGDIGDDKHIIVDGTTDSPPNKDVDLRQLPSVIGKKRPSTETRDSPNAKKSKTEMFDVLFGSEDIDLRQLPPAVMSSPKGSDRPPTPPPPIISENKPTPSNRHSDVPLDKIIISPADEECIKAGNMTKAQETALMSKIIAQIETQKLREAKRKESESASNQSISISLQPISDDEFEADFNSNETENEGLKRIASPSDDKSSRILREDPSKEEQYKENRVREREDRIIPPQNIIQPEETYPKFPRIMEHRDPRANRPWRGRHRQKGWDNMLSGPMLRPGMRPPIRPPAPEPWMRPMNDTWRGMGPPLYHNNFGPEQMIPNIPPHMLEQGSHSPNSSNHDVPALEYAAPNSFKFITIDGEPREIRYYDETAIVFMSAGDPREITFHNGVRRIFFDGEPHTLKFNHPYEEISIKGTIHKVRLGAPSREIFIDGKGYQCYFDQNEKTIELDGNTIMVKLEPPPPHVKIGQEKRLDLVAGKIQLVVDAKNMFTIFLDAKPQKFQIDGVEHTLKFVDALRAVLINDVRFEVEFGGLPKPVMLHDAKHFIRFSVLPKGIKPGHVHIKDMEVCQPFESPKNDNENSQDGFSTQMFASTDSLMPTNISAKKSLGCDSPDRNSNSPHHFQHLIHQQNFNNLDMLSSVLSSSMIATSTEGGYKVESGTTPEMHQEIQPSNSISLPSMPTQETTAQPAFNINELFQRLVATGIVTTAASVQPTEQQQLPPFSPSKTARNTNNIKQLKPVDFTKPETLKIRRQPLIQSLHLGMQCSSCGMRFPPEQSMYYSQHLDWHFRQNRRGKKNIRKASSRRWYYTFSDWKNYEELEDLEEREKSYFENQQQSQNEGANEEGEEEIEIPCVPADPNVQNAICEVCQDRFEQFYNEEKDEWQLRMAVRVDDKTYHPLCYEDYQASLVDVTLDESKLNNAPEPESNSNSGIPLLEVPCEESLNNEEEKAENDEDDVMEVIDNIDDDEVPAKENDQQEEPKIDDEADDDEDDDVIINEVIPEKIVLDDDDKDDYVPPDDDGLIPGVVVKEEPIDDGFVDVGNGVVKTKTDIVKIKSEPVDNDEPEPNTLPPDSADTTHIEVVSSIDGNVELDAGLPTASGISNKIKINITKPLPTVVPKESRDIISEELKTDCIDPSQPLPPGEEPVQLHVKPTLKGLELKRQPTVKKGSELTGLCSIM